MSFVSICALHCLPFKHAHLFIQKYDWFECAWEPELLPNKKQRRINMEEKVNGISGQLHLLSGTNVAQIWASDMFCSHELPCWVSIVPAHSKAVTLGLVCDALCVCVVSIVVFSDAITVIEFWASSACGSPCPSYSHNQSIFHTLSLYPFSYCMHWAMTCFVHKLTKKKKHDWY